MFKKVIKIIILIILILFILPFSKSNALSVPEAGQAIANFAINTADNHKNETIYSYRENEYGGGPKDPQGRDFRQRAYEGLKSSGVAVGSSTTGRDKHEFQNKYAFDCTGFVDFVIHQSLGIGREKWQKFVNSGSDPIKDDSFELVKDKNGKVIHAQYQDIKQYLKPGDILSREGHVMIYVSTDTVVHCIGNKETGGGVKRSSTGQYEHKRKYYIARITSEAASEITTVNTWVNETGSGGTIIDDEDSGLIFIPNLSEDFYYNGVPKQMQTSVERLTLKLILSKLTQVLDWILGFMFLGIKAVFVGWANIIEVLIADLIELVSKITIGERVLLEDIIFNRIAVLDINFFNFSTAGGQPIPDGSIISIIKTNIAMWYNIIRTITIIGLLVTLIYIGIQIAISTTQKKAKYKSMLVSWFISFFIVFFIHYFMIIIVNLNEGILSIFGDISNVFGNLYEQLFTNIHKIQLTISWTASIIYGILIYYTIKFLLIYFKRFVVLAILTLMSPVIAIGYAIDKIKDNKSQSLSKWMKEYIFNVFIQLVHAILFTIFILTSIQLVNEMKWETALPAAIMAFMGFNIMGQGEKWMKKIFGMEQQGSSLGEVMSATIKSFAGIQAAKSLFKPYSEHVVKPIAEATIGKGIDNVRLDMIKNNPRFRAQVGSQMPGATFTDINKKIDKAAREELAARKEYNKKVRKAGIGTVVRGAKSLAALPLSVINPAVGLTMLARNRNQNHYRTEAIKKATGVSKKYNGKKYKFGGTLATLLTFGAIDELSDKFGYEGRQISGYYPGQREQQYSAQNAEVKIVEEKEKLVSENPEMFVKKKDKSGKVKVVLNSKYTTKLQNNLKDVFRKVPDQITIKNEIEEYKKATTLSNLGIKDASNILDKLGFKTTTTFKENLKDKGIQNMNSDQIAQLLHGQLTDKNNIRRSAVIEEFEPIVKQAEVIKEANEKAKSITGEYIYKDVNELIEKIVEDSWGVV